ncbi:helix-turn-helix domain-containing protein [Streptomyces sp. NPDC052644]
MTDKTRAKTQITDPTGRSVASNVRRVRDLRGLSTYDVSRLLSAVGRPITASAIAKVERGERRVDVGDLTALAAVLRVNPSALLLPLTDDPADTIEITGVGSVDAERAWDWMDGEMPIEHIEPGDPTGALLQFQVYARPVGRRMQLAPGGDD